MAQEAEGELLHRLSRLHRPDSEPETQKQADGHLHHALASRGPAAGWPPTSVWAGCVPPEHQESSNNNFHLRLHFRRLLNYIDSFVSWAASC